MNRIGKDAAEQTAKQNRWGTLAARLEAQCEDVLSMELGEMISSGATNGDAASHSANGGGGGQNYPHNEIMCRDDSLSQSPSGGPVAHPAPSSHATAPYQQPMRHQPQPQPLPLGQSDNSTSLKDWIVTKKVEKEIKRATSPDTGNTGVSSYERHHIENCVKIAHLLVGHLAKSLEGTKNKSMNTGDADDWEPSPKDIDEDCITVTEDPFTGDVVDVGFNIYRNFDWDHDNELDTDDSPSNEQKLGLIFRALGGLLYKLFMEGEDVPPCPQNTAAAMRSDGGNNIAIPNEDDILDMLRELPKTVNGSKNDWITSTMRKNGNIPLSLCRLVTDLLHTSAISQSNTGHSSQNEDNSSSCFVSISDVHSDIQQMIDLPDAFLDASINSRWELVFGNNHMFGRKKELQQLMDAAYRIQSDQTANNLGVVSPEGGQRKKEVVMVNGHAGSGKSRLVREIRKPLQAQGWLFLRCKFGKNIQSEPLSVIALGLDEYFSSTVACCSSTIGSTDAFGCSCTNSCCPRRVCQRLESLVGLDGLKSLSRQMPSLRSIIGEPLDQQKELQGKFHTHHIFGTLLDTLAFFSPVLFFVDDLQWADAASFELLTGLINRVVTNFDGDNSTNRILFVGSYRSDDIMEEASLKAMIQRFNECHTINTTEISLRGFELESLNEMVSEALCLPRRKTRSLSKIIHLKTQGFPLFVVEFLDALWTENLLVHDSANGWEWDVDAIDLKGISKSVAELLTRRLNNLPPDVLSGIQVLSCFGSHVDFDVLEAVKNYDRCSSNNLMLALHTAQEKGIVEKAGPTYTFCHDLIQQGAFNLIEVEKRVPLLQKLVSCLIPSCMHEEVSDSFLFVTLDLINKIGPGSVSNNPTQSQLFAHLNLDSGKRAMAANEFSTAVKQFDSGISFLQANFWQDQYDLSLNLFENSALANYSEGNHEQVVVQVNHVLSNARNFEDKFKSYCVFINVIAISSMERAAEKLYDLLRPLGENIDPNAITPQLALNEMMSTRDILSGSQKDLFLHLFQMTDRTKLMSMKLMAMLVLYYNQQQTYLNGYLACKIIRISLQHGHSEDTVFALSVFSATLENKLFDVEEGCALAHTALSLLKFYNASQLIPRVYGVIYGTVLVSKDSIQSLLDPLLQACRLSFSSGNYENSNFNTMVYLSRSMHAGKKLPVVLNELNAFAHQHKQQNHMNILQLFLAPCYKTLSALSGTTLDSSELLAELAAACNDDIVETARAKNEMLFVKASIALSLFNALLLRDFAKASQVIMKYSEFFQILHEPQMRINTFEVMFHAGLVSFHMARETREGHWMEKGMNVLTSFEKASMLNEWNFEHRFLLLKAEMHHTKGDTNAAAHAYDLSAEAAQKHCFIHHVGLICELAAHYFGNIRAKERTREMIQRSHDAYREWGAVRKAKTVINLLELKWLDGS